MELFNYINILSKGRDRVIIRICTILSQREDIEQSYLYNRNLLRSVYNRADRVVVMTDYAMKEMMAQYGIKRKKLVKIPNPVTNPERREEEEVWKYGEHTVVCVGRLEDVKQHNVAIRAFAMTAEKIPDARLLILGVGLNAAKLRSLIKSLKLEDKVQLLGFKKNINYYLEHAKVFLMTSKTEGFPNSMLEAMSVGVPVVSIDSPGAPGEILKAESGSHKVQYGIYGIVTPYINHHYLSKEPITDEERQLSDAVTELLMDEELWKRYAEASRKRAAMYNMEKIMNCWNRLIEKK
jgi:glycosyltransferase involved in cell wall biosynthesis